MTQSSIDSDNWPLAALPSPPTRDRSRAKRLLQGYSYHEDAYTSPDKTQHLLPYYPSGCKSEGDYFSIMTPSPRQCDFPIPPPPDFRYTELFRRCAGVLTYPLSSRFVLDPIKLGWNCSYFTHDDNALCVGQDGKKRALDLGHLLAAEESLQISHNDTDRMDVSRNTTEHTSSNNRITEKGISRLTSLPDGSVDLISAKSLHSIRTSGNINNRQLFSTPYVDRNNPTILGTLQYILRECYRVLSPGGCIEYIFFEDQLYRCGLLTKEVEYFLKESEIQAGPEISEPSSIDSGPWDFNYGYSASKFHPQTISLKDFSQCLGEVGFKTQKNMVIPFPVLTLSRLFDKSGCKREPPVPPTYEIWTSSFPKDQQLPADCPEFSLLGKIHSECEELGTFWKCSIGWACKPP
ncbi:hypothetical protein TWF281_010864 [Arthrobotrys megalospora]